MRVVYLKRDTYTDARGVIEVYTIRENVRAPRYTAVYGIRTYGGVRRRD